MPLAHNTNGTTRLYRRQCNGREKGQVLRNVTHPDFLGEGVCKGSVRLRTHHIAIGQHAPTTNLLLLSGTAGLPSQVPDLSTALMSDAVLITPHDADLVIQQPHTLSQLFRAHLTSDVRKDQPTQMM